MNSPARESEPQPWSLNPCAVPHEETNNNGASACLSGFSALEASAPTPSGAKSLKATWLERCRVIAGSPFVFIFSLASVSCWGFAGNACRISLSAVCAHYGLFLRYTYFGPNAVGSFAMGLFQTLLPSEMDMPLLQRGLCAGFCGSFTTLSSWILNIGNATSGAAGLEELLSGVTIPFVCFVWGSDLGKAVRRSLTRCRSLPRGDPEEGDEAAAAAHDTAALTPSQYSAVDVAILVVMGSIAVTVPTALYAVQHYHRHPGEPLGRMSSNDLRSVMLAPCGAVPRFVVGYFMNKQPRWGSFPVGTLVCNVVAVLLSTLMFREMYRPDAGEGYAAVLTGVCGSLSTVSSFVSETVGLHREERTGMAYGYLMLTLAITTLIASIGRQENFR